MQVITEEKFGDVVERVSTYRELLALNQRPPAIARNDLLADYLRS